MNENLIYEYERILTDSNKVTMDTYHFKDLSNDAQEKTAVVIIQYAILYICHWTPAEALRNLNEDVLARLKLKGLMKYIQIPTGLDEKERITYVLHLCFPDKIKFNQRKKVELFYENILDTKGAGAVFPKRFFTNYDANFNAAICLQYFIKRYVKVDSIDELYFIFNTTEMKKKLVRYRLSKPLNKIYGGNTLDYLHNSLTPKERNNFLYYSGKYNQLVKKILK